MAGVQINWDKDHNGPTGPGSGPRESEMAGHQGCLVDLCGWLLVPEVKWLFCGDQGGQISTEGLISRWS